GDHAVAERLDAVCGHPIDAALRNDICTLPVVAAIEHDEQRTGFDVNEYVGAVGVAAGDAKPQDVHRCAVIVTVQTRPVAHDRVTPIAADHEIGVNGQFSIGRVGANADDAAPLFDQVGRLCPHVQ